ncbi:hypothetical protein ACQ0MK_20395 [Thalassospira lucentensis]|uniref:hypothetical protein n=1 Tax=Thalassospira lucentensis TaxID=168935 RepID=UPI003D2EF72D
MYASIVATALILHYAFVALGAMPESSRNIAEVSAFAINYTLFLNIAAFVMTGGLLWLRREGRKSTRQDHDDEHDHHHGDGSALSAKNIIVASAGMLLAGGLALQVASLL